MIIIKKLMQIQQLQCIILIFCVFQETITPSLISFPHSKQKNE